MHRASQVRRERFFRRGSRKAREIAPSRPDDHPQQCRDSHMVAEFVVGGASMVWIAVVEGLLNHEFRDFDFESMCKVQEHRHLSQQDIGVTAPASDADTCFCMTKTQPRGSHASQPDGRDCLGRTSRHHIRIQITQRVALGAHGQVQCLHHEGRCCTSSEGRFSSLPGLRWKYAQDWTASLKFARSVGGNFCFSFHEVKSIDQPATTQLGRRSWRPGLASWQRLQLIAAAARCAEEAARASARSRRK